MHSHISPITNGFNVLLKGTCLMNRANQTWLFLSSQYSWDSYITSNKLISSRLVLIFLPRNRSFNKTHDVVDTPSNFHPYFIQIILVPSDWQSCRLNKNFLNSGTSGASAGLLGQEKVQNTNWRSHSLNQTSSWSFHFERRLLDSRPGGLLESWGCSSKNLQERVRQ